MHAAHVSALRTAISSLDSLANLSNDSHDPHRKRKQILSLNPIYGPNDSNDNNHKDAKSGLSHDGHFRSCDPSSLWKNPFMLGVTCQLCSKRPATSHLTELDPDTGQRQELHICATCIQRLDLKLENGPPSIAEILDMKSDDASSAKIKIASSLNMPAIVKNDERCPHCGLAFSEFGSGKLFGCAHDYAVFGDKVETLLRNYHGTTRHVGRRPGSEPDAPESAATVHRASLDAALRQAVINENYENAAKLRDQLRQLDEPSA